MNSSGVDRSIGIRESAEQSPESDGALLIAISRKSQSAFGEAYDRHIYLVAWFARARLPAALVDDVVQATFLTLWNKADRVHLSGESLAPWLLGVCKQHSRALLRKDRRHHHSEIPDAVTARDNVEAEALNRHLLDAIKEHIAQLGPLDQQVYALCIEQDLSYEAAAASLGISAPAVRGRLHRLRSGLRHRFGGE